MIDPLTYSERTETVKRASPRFLALEPPPELLLTEPTARLERGLFATVAAVAAVLSDPYSLEHMTLGDLRRLVRLGELAGEMLEEKQRKSKRRPDHDHKNSTRLH